MDVEELSHLIENYGKDVYGFCCKLTRDKHQADDLYQEAFLKATELCHRIDDTQNPKIFHGRISGENSAGGRGSQRWWHFMMILIMRLI